MRKTVRKIRSWLESHPCALVTDAAYQLASLKHAPDMADVIWEIKRAFAKGIEPERSIHGASSTFFLKDCDGRPIAVFKRNHCLNEVAAYRLDHQHFAKVPQTIITTLKHPFWGEATGACQYFVPHSFAVVALQKRVIQAFLPESVRKIAILDIRTMNEDRHGSNILLAGKDQLIPVDHGFIFPADLSGIFFVWAGWPQASTPFSETELSYIAQLNPEADRRLLIDELHIEENCANRLFVATIFLKLAALRNLNACTIGKMMMTPKKRLPLRSYCEPVLFKSLIEKIKERHCQNWTIFSQCVYEEIEKTLDRIEDEKTTS